MQPGMCSVTCASMGTSSAVHVHEASMQRLHAASIQSLFGLYVCTAPASSLQVVLPLLCFDAEDAELWEDDPQEFVRKVRLVQGHWPSSKGHTCWHGSQLARISALVGTWTALGTYDCLAEGTLAAWEGIGGAVQHGISLNRLQKLQSSLRSWKSSE